MIKLLPKILITKSFRFLGSPKVLPFNYTLLISTKCNARCKTCNIFKQKHDELTINEWGEILKSLGNSPFWVTISGGEPFLSPHLVDLCQLIFQRCQPTILTIPTNSLPWKLIPKRTEKILKSAQRTKAVINLSLDGIGEKHDEIRGVKGNFEAFEKTYRNLKKLKGRHQNLMVGVHSVISKFNVQNAEELFDFVFSLNPDQYITEVAEERAELDTIGSPITPSYKEYSQVIDSLITRIKGKTFKGLARITEAFRLEYYDFAKKWLKGEKIGMKDYAGWASGEITSWGEVWPSCIHGINFGNLREVNYDFPKIWFGKKAQEFRRKYQNKPESFPLANAFYSSALFDLKTMVKVALNILNL
jgi:MoaA/NifB/PqqE/SkfB family radical SAM enzyme